MYRLFSSIKFSYKLQGYSLINPFPANAPILYPLKTADFFYSRCTLELKHFRQKYNNNNNNNNNNNIKNSELSRAMQMFAGDSGQIPRELSHGPVI